MQTRLLTQNTLSARAWRNILCWTALCFAGAPMLSAQIVLSESFETGERLVQNLPDTSAWYGSSNNLSEIAGGIRLATTATQHLYTYFTDSGALSIPVGQYLQVTYQFKLQDPGNSSTAFRVGLFNSGGSRNTDESQGASISAYRNYVGYGAFLNPVTTSSGQHSIRERKPDLADGLLHVGTPWTTLGSGGTALTLASMTLYTGVFTITRTGADTLQISHSVSGPSVSDSVTVAVAADAVTAFDTFAIAGLGGANRAVAVELHDVQITIVPEPSTYVALAGLLALGLVMARRRARS